MDRLRPLVLEEEPYSTDNVFSTADERGEVEWDRLLPGEVEGYRFHLAFELAKVEGFRTGYVTVGHSGKTVCIAPYFITDYSLDSTVQGPLKRVTRWLQIVRPNLFKLRIVCAGSAVTDSGKLCVATDPAIMTRLCDELERIARREGVSVIAFKDLLQGDADRLDASLRHGGFARIANMPVASIAIDFDNLDGYFRTLNTKIRTSLRHKRKRLAEISIEEYDGMPPDIEGIYRLYLNCFERSDLQFEKLTPDFFRGVATLLPNNCRFVLYRAEGRLIGFNLLLHKNGMLMDKYIGFDYDFSYKYYLYFLNWLNNIEMCLRDGFHIFQAGQAGYETKLMLGSRLEQTYIFFRHRQPLLNKLLRFAARFLAYENFDDSVKKNHQSATSGQ
jgi:hypothetical protein